MAPRDPSLPEGTDHIIDTNIDLGDTGGGSGGGAGGLGGGSGGLGGGTGGGAGGLGGGSGGAAGGLGGGSSAAGGAGAAGGTGTGGSGGGSAFQFDKGASGGSSSGGSSNGSRTSGIAGQVREQISTLKSQAGDRARSFADDGKSQATSLLQTVAQIVADAAGSVEERLGSQYSGMGHRASSSINSLASTLDERSVDDLIEDARTFVQRSPAAAIGVAAVLGFAIARVVRSSVSEYNNETGAGGGASGATGGTGGGTGLGATGGTGGGSGFGAGASGGLDATSGGFGEQGVGTAGSIGGSGVSTGPGSSGGTGNAPTI
jgi:ElaB/YqjD/DUF883 family membrane-anchored ribosome-binding protein